ncbi:MAG: carboxylate--amine ligase [Caloramator sp.]|jgi:predicted ATP-grasp superfamily ATP-dependent carboligase|uniref:carboxylate--amine ligase n=1 Tax=Caloramator sp. TaxID=1871330 RepID=UPI001DF3834D|nr:carboxylate--amine ligase [Caloramator sp.]MBZ4663443.1 carboxylate--amine ligase [Caloramator sp.]
MEHKNKAVVLGANYYIGLSVIRCLGSEGVKVAAVDYSKKGTYGFYSKYCSEILIGPHYKEKPQEFLQFLIDYAKKQEHPPVLFPCADPYVEFVDEHLDVLKQYYLIHDIERDLYTKLMNKGTLRDLAIEHGVRVPETVSVDEENFIEKVEKEIKYPCLVKPVDSHTFVSIFRRKLFKVYNREELLECVQKAKEANTEVIIQRIIKGFDDCMHTFDAYLNKDSKVTHWVTCQKMRQYPINYGASVYTKQKYVPELYDIGAKFLEGVKFKGFAEIEFKKDEETENFYLIEVNVRTTNLNNLLYKVGINMPYIAYRDLTGNPLPNDAVTWDTNRAFWYAYEDILAIKEYIRTKQLTLSQVITSFFRPKAYAIWDIKDPKPFFVFLNSKISRVFDKIFKRG